MLLKMATNYSAEMLYSVPECNKAETCLKEKICVLNKLCSGITQCDKSNGRETAINSKQGV